MVSLSLSDIAAVEYRVAQLSGERAAPAPNAASTAEAFSALLSTAAPTAERAAPARCIVPQPLLERIIARACAATGTDPALVKAVVANESGFDAGATSSAGAAGLMQLMPATAAGVGVSDRYDPEQNVNGGTTYLHGLIARFGGNYPLAIAAYNAGPAAVERGAVGPETTDYVRAVLASFDAYRRGDASR